MKSIFLSCISLLSLLTALPVNADKQPNVLFIIADDASLHFGQSYDCDWVKTPNIDKLAKTGLIFDNCYVVSAKCAPCRVNILTGRNTWQKGEAANHRNYYPANLPAFSKKLKDAGVYTGSRGKVWGPGRPIDSKGVINDLALPTMNKSKAGEAFAHFLAKRPANTPFFYWHGSNDPHRGYPAGSGRKAGKKLSDINRVPAYWPDNETVRSDMLDYALRVERFDSHVGEIITELEKAGLADNTLVIVTSDHGMPFPRVKGHTFDDAHRVPTVMSWPKGIKNPGKRVDDLVSFIDFAPTFLELAGIDPSQSGMEITGKSITDLFTGERPKQRPFLLIGRERFDVYARPGSAAGLGYPARGIRSGDYLYVLNFTPDRWPCGNPELGLKDTDDSPTKRLIEKLGPGNPYWEHAFGKRPTDMLFNVKKDPDCVNNLADNKSLATILGRLKATMMAELKKQGDPRTLGEGKGDVFDNYPTPRKAPQGWGSTPIATKESQYFTPKQDLEGLNAQSEAVQGLPKVLIIGDSISIGYTKLVVDQLKGVANVQRPKSNCGPTTRGLTSLKKWLGTNKWDVIHFNWGLHDLCYRHPQAKAYGNRDKVNGSLSVPLDQYEKNLEQLVTQLKKTGAKLIWASTTVVPEGEAGRKVGDEIKYNAIALKIMAKHGVAINDLHQLTASLPATSFTKPGDVHFTRAGYDKLAAQVAESILSVLKAEKKTP